MRIGVYALAKNELKHVPYWADSCADADVRVVTDTGSTDGTDAALVDEGVTVARGSVVPWRWDDAHNLSLYHLPADLDVCVRLDLDERLQPGWRQAIERAWTGDVNNLHYRYVWSWQSSGEPGVAFTSDRVHARHGFRWASPTHEGLTCWAGQRVIAHADGLEIHHYRDPGKKHVTDLTLLEVAIRETPNDARAHWYYARELDYAGRDESADAFRRYLDLPGGSATERAYACRVLYRRTGNEHWAHRSVTQCSDEPDGWLLLALIRHHQRQWRDSLAFAVRACECTQSSHATDPLARARAADLASVASWELGLRRQALTLGERAASQLPDDERIQSNVRVMAQLLAGAA